MLTNLQKQTKALSSSVHPLLIRLLTYERPMLLRTEIMDLFEAYAETENGRNLRGTLLQGVFSRAEEALAFDARVLLCVRLGVADWHWIEFHTEPIDCIAITVRDFLKAKEGLVSVNQGSAWIPELDLEPFGHGFPTMKEADWIGHGVEFLNRHLSHNLAGDHGRQQLFNFLKLHRSQGVQLLLNEQVQNVDELQQSLRSARKFLATLPSNTEWIDFAAQLPATFFEPGWGRTAAQVREMMGLLLEILQAPGPQQLQEFLSRIPMIYKLAILSPHGYFGQSGVLGLPDTGGQVVYILDQVRALERQMRADLHEQGLNITPSIIVVTRLIPEAGNTTCHVRTEPIAGTESAYILRIPFRNKDGKEVPHWISRFKIWPYLEQFAVDVEHELVGVMGGKPDVVIGNYSDGNLVATLLAESLGVTQFNIAHALEKTKYLYSAVNWKEHEDEHHFSCQFTADLIAMNSADCIITSTYQEIAGTDDSVGQYESYASFTMPDLYRVLYGIDVFDPKFNIISPGADANVYFTYSQKGKRLIPLHGQIESLIFGNNAADARGCLLDRDKPLIFSMARLDSVKNISGLLRWYAESPALQKEANLFLVSGKVDPDASADSEERAQSLLMHQLIDEHSLEDRVRWVNAISDKVFNGEMYRYIADRRGIFVQPALFEAFGLTVIEAMVSGLPTFATCYGGPLEIIEDGVSGFHIVPERGDESAQRMVDFFIKARENPDYWQRISEGGQARVADAYTWDLYAKRMLSLSRIYGFWKHITRFDRQETRRYLEMFYAFMYRSRASQVPTA